MRPQNFIVAFAVAAMLTPLPRAVGAPATAIPGGANQRAGISGPLNAELFNGRIRLRKMSFTRKNLDGDDVFVFSTLVTNGTHQDRVTLLEAHLADADGVTVDQTPGDPVEGPCTLAPGAACHESFHFKLPSADFKPVKILVEEMANGSQPVFRVNL